MLSDRSWEAYINRVELEDENGNVTEEAIMEKFAEMEETIEAIEAGTTTTQTPTVTFDGELPF